MLNYWILPVSNEKRGKRVIRGIDKYQQRKKDNFWGFGKKVNYGLQIEQNDKAVFYLAGKDGYCFLGTCTIDSKCHALSEDEKKRYWHGIFFDPESGVNLRDVKDFSSPIPIRPLKKQLDFIKDKENWGLSLHDNIIRISQKDYETIV